MGCIQEFAIGFLLDPEMMLRYHYDEYMRGLVFTLLEENYDYDEDATVLSASFNKLSFPRKWVRQASFSVCII